MRIDKFLAHTGFGSRTIVKKMIKENRVKVNDIVCKNNNIKVDIYSDVIKVDGNIVPYKEFYYLMLNKPKGYVSANKDNLHQTVFDLLEPIWMNRKLSIIGRLDKDTTGLMLLSNDGRFVHKIISPNKNIYKQYIATLDKELEQSDLVQLESGIEIRDGNGELFLTKEAKLQKTTIKNDVLISIKEGKYHQVKKMFLKLGYEVLELKRVAIGSLQLDPNLKLSHYRELKEEEIEALVNDLGE